LARRRVFQTNVKCPGVSENLGLTSNRTALVNRRVTLAKLASDSEVSVCLDGIVLGHLDHLVGSQVASAIDRGQLFVAVIKHAYQNYDEKFLPTTALICLKVEYVLEKGQTAIEVPKAQVEGRQRSSRSFFTKIAGVSHEGRQRVVARCSVGERLVLVRDPANRFDNGAIKVLRLNGEELGFIPAHVSRGGDPSGLAFQMDRGGKYQCRIKDLTGGDEDNLGVNIEVAEGEDVDSLPLPAKAPQPSSVEPDRINLGWLLAAAALVLLVVVIILRNQS
jgi:hypothetical protein